MIAKNSNYVLMKKVFQVLIIPFLLSFAPPYGEVFNKSGVYFKVPDGWKITDEEDFDGKGYYLSCEKNGANSSGLVTVSWVNDSTDLTSTAENYAAELKKNYILKTANPIMKPVKQTTFNGKKAMAIAYMMTLANLPHEGHIYSFYGNHKTITVMMQEALEDHAENRAGFEEITKTLASK